VLKHLVVHMIPGGGVEGRVRDTDGNPAFGIPVELLRYEYNFEGKRVEIREAIDSTDDRGEYRLFWLTPGNYYLRAGGVGTSREHDLSSKSGGVMIDDN